MKNILIVVLLICAPLFSNADSWKDPTWKQMLSDSDAIALIEYISSGEFRAEARVIRIYKGEIKSEIIWISGFSNRYGPIDKMEKGDQFIVFLNQSEPSKRNLEYWEKETKKNKKLIPYVKALKEGRVFHVWSPTAGDLKIKSNTVQYDLIQTSYYKSQNFYPLNEFEVFLKAATKPQPKFHSNILKVLKQNVSNHKTSQLVMMLFLTDYKSYNTVYETILNIDNINSHYALAKLLGNIDGEDSRNALIKLLDSKNSIVQGEAVRQLSNQDPDLIGPILLNKLSKAGEDGIYPSGIMDPVRNSIDGGKIEIIKTLGTLEYKPAIPKLLPLLETDNEYLFGITFEVLHKLGTKDYIPYLNKHLEQGTKDLIFDICRLIADLNLSDCIPALMQFISNHDKSVHPSKEYSISNYMGLANFDTPEVRQFLKTDFKKVLAMKPVENIDTRREWIESYIDVFNHLKITDIKADIYHSLFDYYGIDNNFKLNPELFLLKNDRENSTLRTIKKQVAGENIKTIKFLELVDFSENEPKRIDLQINLTIESEKRGWNNLQEVFEALKAKLTANGIAANGLSITCGHMTQSFGGTTPLDFDDTLMSNFIEYISTNPDKKDLTFLQNLLKFNYAKTDREKESLNKAISTCKLNLN